jgi:hypothetical protein
MNILFEGTKSQDNKIPSFLRWWFSQFFWCIFVEKIITKVFEASLKSLASYENPSSNPLQELVSALKKVSHSRLCLQELFRKGIRLLSWKLFLKPAMILYGILWKRSIMTVKETGTVTQTGLSEQS